MAISDVSRTALNRVRDEVREEIRNIDREIRPLKDQRQSINAKIDALELKKADLEANILKFKQDVEAV